jgi:hypothetical protein
MSALWTRHDDTLGQVYRRHQNDASARPGPTTVVLEIDGSSARISM